MADRYVKSVIESARGVGQVMIEGAAERAVQINIDADQLAAYRTSIMQVHDAIVAQNAEVPGGRVDAGFRELSLRTLGRMPDSRDFNDLVVATVDDVPRADQRPGRSGRPDQGTPHAGPVRRQAGRRAAWCSGNRA